MIKLHTISDARLRLAASDCLKAGCGLEANMAEQPVGCKTGGHAASASPRSWTHWLLAQHCRGHAKPSSLHGPGVIPDNTFPIGDWGSAGGGASTRRAALRGEHRFRSTSRHYNI